MKSEKKRASRETGSASEGLVFDIQRFSLHGGYGIRTLVFMKGCLLKCGWCSYPESQRGSPEIMFCEENCIGCKSCIAGCPFGKSPQENWQVARETCLGCGRCTDVCYAEAHRRRTGVGNERILDNARRSVKIVGEMILRFPLIPGFNDAPEHVRLLGSFIQKQLPAVKRIYILPYHSVGESKSLRLAKKYALSIESLLAGEKIREVEDILKVCGLSVIVWG